MPALNLAESLDHFVVPVDDMIAAEEFYVQVFGGMITKRNGLNVRQRKRGAVPRNFIQIGRTPKNGEADTRNWYS
ncbi:MAG TPA: VOC family protein [Candidatus Binatia bacterium]|nr:VOC family protein [Candidatus Binatia bacterium]